MVIWIDVCYSLVLWTQVSKDACLDIHADHEIVHIELLDNINGIFNILAPRDIDRWHIYLGERGCLQIKFSVRIPETNAVYLECFDLIAWLPPLRDEGLHEGGMRGVGITEQIYVCLVLPLIYLFPCEGRIIHIGKD